MKQVLFCLLLATVLSCNSNEKAATKETTATETTDKGNGEMKDGISDYANNKESFLLTCRIDAANSLEGHTQEQINTFCECAWDKTKGKYPGPVVANETKLSKDPQLKDCYDDAKKK